MLHCKKVKMDLIEMKCAILYPSETEDATG